MRSSFDSILGHKQVMDAYLLALAHHNGALFLTFDARIRAMQRGSDVVELIC